MKRRDTLRNGAVLGATGGLSLLAGCSGDDSDGGENGESGDSLSVETFDYREGDDGELVVTVAVKNAEDAEASGKLYVTVSASESTSETETEDDGDDITSARKSIDVTVAGGETTTFEIPFEFTVKQFKRDGSLEVDLRE